MGMPEWWCDKFGMLKWWVGRLDIRCEFMTNVELFEMTTEIVNLAQYLQVMSANRIRADAPPELDLDE